MVSSLILDGPTSVASSSSASSSSASSISHAASTLSTDSEKNPGPIKIIFSDLDGTLIHYPTTETKTKTKGDAAAEIDKPEQKVLKFPPSSTGLRGEISTRTVSLVDEIRRQHGVRFVLVTGMRTSTLLQRLPYLPRADAYCSENGGRIFYPVENGAFFENDNDKEEEEEDNDDVFWVSPEPYRHDGNAAVSTNPYQHKRFGIREDRTWRARMIESLGGDSFGRFSLDDIHEALNDPAAASVPLYERDGFLWDFARDLVHTHGFVVDTKGYSTCFRVNRKQQVIATNAATPPSEILAVLDGPRWKSDPSRSTVSASVNLSCVDFYPSSSGKRNRWVIANSDCRWFVFCRSPLLVGWLVG